jgi:hypothetical protein
MTAVTQTEAFSKLDEGTVKDFITKVLCAWAVKTSFLDPDPNSQFNQVSGSGSRRAKMIHKNIKK